MLKMTTEKQIDAGVVIGIALAMIISWERNKSILWAVIHGLLGWLYVIYYYFVLRPGDESK